MIELPAWSTALPRDPTWQVLIDGRPAAVLASDRGGIASWTVDGPCTVEAQACGGLPPRAQARLRPSGHAIAVERRGDWLACRLPGPMHGLLDVDGLPPLHLFADPAPASAPAGARVVASGTIATGGADLQAGETLWIERGAALIGRIRASGAGVRIGGGGLATGRGAGCSGHFLRADHCPELRIEDLTVSDPGGWAVVVGASDGAVIDNLRVVTPGAGAGTDGLDLVGSSRVRVRGCYIVCGDDALVIKAFVAKDPDGRRFAWDRPVRDIVFTDCIIGTAGGCGMEIGHELTVDAVEDIAYRGIQIMFAHQFGAPFGIHAGDRAIVRRISYERVRIDHCYNKLLDLRVMRSRYNHDTRRGQVQDIAFTDIDWKTSMYNQGYTSALIGGHDEVHRVSGVSFIRFRKDGVAITSGDDIDLLTCHADGISFG